MLILILSRWSAVNCTQPKSTYALTPNAKVHQQSPGVLMSVPPAPGTAKVEAACNGQLTRNSRCKATISAQVLQQNPSEPP